jgi:drug/metabolite transporter (DMT)-like permease
MGKTEWVLLFVLAMIWGGSYFFAKVALNEISPMNLVFLRVILASLALYILIKLLHKKIPKDISIWKSFFVMGLINNIIPFALLFWGQTHINSSLAAIFNCTVPIFTIIIAHIFTSDERISKNKILGIALGFVGVIIMIGADIQEQTNKWAILAMFACVFAAVSYAIATVYGRRFQQFKVEPLVVAFGQVTASSIILLPIIITSSQLLHVTTLSAATLLSVLALGFICTAIAYVIYFRILAKGGATNISLVVLLIPVSAIVLGVIILGEQIKLSYLMGMLIIFAGLIAIDGRLWNLLRSKQLPRKEELVKQGIVKPVKCNQ